MNSILLNKVYQQINIYFIQMEFWTAKHFCVFGNNFLVIYWFYTTVKHTGNNFHRCRILIFCNTCRYKDISIYYREYHFLFLLSSLTALISSLISSRLTSEADCISAFFLIL